MSGANRTDLGLMSNYPGGFGQGISIQNLPVLNSYPSKVFWVDSVAGSNGNPGTFQRPFATIDYAIGRCTASVGDLILVKAGHVETLVAAGAITMDVAGVTVQGLGVGNNRPKLTFTPAAASTNNVTWTAANCSFTNFVCVAGLDALTNPFNISGAQAYLDIEWQDGSSTVEAETVVLTTAAADKLAISLKYLGFTAGNACVAPIKLVGATDARIYVDFHGIASTSVVNFITTLSTNVNVTGYVYNSGTTDGSKLVVDTIGSSTWYADIVDGAAGARYTGGSGAALASDDITAITNALYGSAGVTTFPVAAAAANGVSIAEVIRYIEDALVGTAGVVTFPSGAAAANGVSLAEVLRYIQDQVINGTGTVLDTNTSLYGVLAGATGIPTFPSGAAAANSVSLAEVIRYIQDQVINGTGTVLPTNTSLYGVLAGATGVPTFPAAAAPANDVSLAEVIRAIYDRQLGDGTNAATNGLLGKRIDRTTADVITSAAVPIFTVAGGRVLVTSITGKVTTIIGVGVTNAKFQFNPTTGTTNDICANLDIDTDEAGALYSISGVASDAMLRSESGAIRNMSSNGLILDVGDVEFITSADRTGSISFQLWYIPLDNGATVVAA